MQQGAPQMFVLQPAGAQPPQQQAMMAMPMPTGAVPGAAPMQPTIVIMAAPAPSPTDTHESPSQHREISGSPSSHHDSPHASDHAGSDASPPRSHSHEHLTEAIEEVLETVLTRHKSHDGDKHGHHDKQHAHPKTGLAVAAGSAVLKQTLQRSAKHGKADRGKDEAGPVARALRHH